MVLRPARTSADNRDFDDPDDNFDPPAYADNFERSLGEDSIVEIEHEPFHTIDPDTSIAQAMALMMAEGISCLMVSNNGRLMGIFTERDVLNKVASRFEQVKDQPVALVMTHNPTAIFATDPPTVALNLMAIGGFRHLPILDVDQKLAGIIGPRRVLAYLTKRLYEE